MTKIQVSNSVNNTFIEFAEDLLNTNSQDIHSLCAALYTAAAKQNTASPQVANKASVNSLCALFCGCLMRGWKDAITGKGAPPFSKTPYEANRRAENLTAPYTTKGFYIGCAQVEQCIKNRHHISQSRRGNQNSTQGETPENAS